ncbi:MAG: hypothetical protein Q9207_005116, partial [Kuettlingeria erythrocarpa]
AFRVFRRPSPLSPVLDSESAPRTVDRWVRALSAPNGAKVAAGALQALHATIATTGRTDRAHLNLRSCMNEGTPNRGRHDKRQEDVRISSLVFGCPNLATMYSALHLFLHLLSLRPLLAATIPATPNLSAPTLENAGFVDNEAISVNQSDLAIGQYTGPFNAQKAVMCNGASFGTRLNLESCLDAVEQLDHRSPLPRSFGPRGTAPRGQVNLPMRSSSGESFSASLPTTARRRWMLFFCKGELLMLLAGDGRCVVDVVRRANAVTTLDYATFGQIWDAATKIIQVCIDGRAINDRGGFMGEVGM